ncbi:cytochrome-c peroxidase [Roseobacter denitrificans]|uniref:cytochrome-c peroxidase n=1 Tax=Roseobacter denitrificans TaxID=2434 RepID=UPI00209B6171|nr:cytochrome c peroxidase [Roseobacter denitrificans]
MGLVKSTRIHEIARRFQFRRNRRGQKSEGKSYCAHGLVLSCFASLAAAADLLPPLTDEDFIEFDVAQAALGQALFYDPILSGNRNITCAHCHHPEFGTGDGLSLGIGEGGQGLGPDRTPGAGADRVAKRIPRNAPGLWNLGARDLHTMFHDGRLSLSDIYGNGFNSPAQEWLPEGLNSLLAAQALFPLVAQFEMAGNPGENDVIGAVHDRIDAAWPILAKRVRTDADYGPAFVAAFDEIDTAQQVSIVHIANALAAFMALEWRSTDSPFDAYLAGDEAALNPAEQAGMALFYGKAACADCHAGSLMSDQKFHALGLPAFGPGRTRAFDPYARDVGRMAESNRLRDAYAFRTPMLRNVALTAPYGHNGAYPTLEGIIRHHLDPVAARAAWQREMAQLPDIAWLAATDFILGADALEMARQERAIAVTPLQLTDAEIAQLVAFMHALTGASVNTPAFGIPSDFVP